MRKSAEPVEHGGAPKKVPKAPPKGSLERRICLLIVLTHFWSESPENLWNEMVATGGTTLQSVSAGEVAAAAAKEPSTDPHPGQGVQPGMTVTWL